MDSATAGQRPMNANLRTLLPLLLLTASGYLPSASAQTVKVNSETSFGCQSKSVYQTLTGYAVSGDNVAFVNGMQSAISKGQCVLFKNGQDAHMLEYELTTGLTKIRPAGSGKAYWTSTGTIRR